MYFSSNLLEEVKTNKYNKVEISALDLRQPVEIGSYQSISSTDLLELCDCVNKNKYIKKISLCYLSLSDSDVEILSQLTNILELAISSNNITSKGVSFLKNLKLKKLDIGANPIGDDGISELSYSETITDLDVSECGITSSGVNKLFKTNNSVKKVNLDGNNITDNGFENFNLNKTIEALILTDNPLTSKCIPFILENSNIKTLHFGGYRNSIDANGLYQLATHPSLKELSFTSGDFKNLKEPLIFKNVEKLIMYQTNIGKDGCKSLIQNTNLKKLDLTGNNIDDECAPFLVSIKNLETLDVSSNKLTDVGYKILKNSPIKSLDCSSNRVNPNLLVFPKLVPGLPGFSSWINNLKENEKMATVTNTHSLDTNEDYEGFSKRPKLK